MNDIIENPVSYSPDESAIIETQEVLKNIGKVIGRSGTEMYSGYFYTDSVDIWNDPQRRAKEINRMTRQFVDCESALLVLKNPILGASWDITGGEQEHIDFVYKQLFESKKRTWQELLIEVLTYIEHGYSVFEKIYDVDEDGLIYISDLAPRIQESIEAFKLTDGRLGVKQILNGDFVSGSSNGYAEIPLDKLMIFTNNKRGDDVMGVSQLRTARMHTSYLDRLYKVQGISAERFGVGIPVVTYPEGGGDKEKNSAVEMAKNLKSNEKSYLAIKENWKIDILIPKGNPMGTAIESAINTHRRQILLSCLAHGLDTGSSGVGSQALAEVQDKNSLSLSAQKARYVADQFNKYFIRPILELNFGKLEEYPVLSFEELSNSSSKEMSEIFNSLITSGVIDIGNPAMVNHIRNVFNLPELTEDEIEELLIKKEQDEQAIEPIVEQKKESNGVEPDETSGSVDDKNQQAKKK